MYTCVEVFVELTESMYQMREDLGSVVSRISYNQALANNITINFYPVTYNQYLNVHWPDSVSLDQSQAEGMYISTNNILVYNPVWLRIMNIHPILAKMTYSKSNIAVPL